MLPQVIASTASTAVSAMNQAMIAPIASHAHFELIVGSNCVGGTILLTLTSAYEIAIPEATTMRNVRIYREYFIVLDKMTK